MVGIEKTELWLEEYFDEPINICSMLVSSSIRKMQSNFMII